MSAAAPTAREEGPAHLQKLLTALDELGDPTARSVARELLQAVIALHGSALAELLGIVEEAGTQSADTLPRKFAANPNVSAVLLLHDLHPLDLATRARQATERLRPHLGVRGVRVDFLGAAGGLVRIRLSAVGQHARRPASAELRREISEAVLEVAPDLTDLEIEGLESTCNASEIYVSVPAVPARRTAIEQPVQILPAGGA